MNARARVTPPPSMAHVTGIAAKAATATMAVRFPTSSLASMYAAPTATRLYSAGNHRSVSIGSPGIAASAYKPSGG